MNHLSVVLPCYNEEKNIERTVRDVLSYFDTNHMDGEVVCVDDGSSDGTKNVIEALSQQDSRVRLARHESNRGYGAAVKTGCDAAQGGIIAFMDSDGQFHAEDLGKLLPLLSKKTPYVTGVRAHRADAFQRRINAGLYNWLIQTILGVSVSDLNCGMKMFTRELWSDAHPVHATGALLNAEMFYLMKQKGIMWKEVPVGHYPRVAGSPTGANLTVILRMFWELLALKRDHKRTV